MSENQLTINNLYLKLRNTDGAGVIETTREKLLDVANTLKKSGYTTLVSLSAIDYPKDNIIELVIAVTGYNLDETYPKIVEILVKIPRDKPRVTSLTRIWPAAEFHEREAFEMFGIFFEEHPHLTHLLLDPEEYKDVYPLRKDFVVREEPIMITLVSKADKKT